MRFEWDHEKAAANITRHGVSFEEASTIFGDRLATTIPDPDHSVYEERWLTTGLSNKGRLLIAWHTDRSEVVRIIGAREVMAKERRVYESEE